MTFIGFLATVVILAVFAVLLILFALGLMHGHLRNKGESFGSSDQLDRIERKLDAIISPNDPRSLN
jgi:hypothetical protein